MSASFEELREELAKTLTAAGRKTEASEVRMRAGEWGVEYRGQFFSYTEIVNELRATGRAIPRH